MGNKKKEKKKISQHDYTRRLCGLLITVLILMGLAFLWLHVFLDKATIFPD